MQRIWEERFSAMRITLHVTACLLAAAAAANAAADQNKAHKKQLDRIEQTHRQEAEALVQLADAAMIGEQVPSDFRLQWRNDFLKAQEGTFVPFIVTIDAAPTAVSEMLLYVRAARRGAPAPDRDGKNGSPFPFDEIFPIELTAERPLRFKRGFAVPPGDYDVYIAVRERRAPGKHKSVLKASVLKQPLAVPDFWTGQLTTSSVILADRLNMLSDPVPPELLAERPYVIGRNDIEPALDSVFRRREELIAVFLVYNPTVLPDKKFDVQVEYHFFVRKPEGEAYLNRTEPQRFNPAILGPQFDPGAGHPLMAGQAVPLASFQEGEYRLAIRVTDLISGKSITRDVNFTVVS
jgi:hypothetical protein